jgi:hypothetical protein
MNWRGIGMGFLVSFVLSACLKEEQYSKAEIQARMDEVLNQKLLDFRLNAIRRCREDMMLEATAIADSMLIQESFLNRDTLTRPPKPIRPGDPIPEVKSLPDTVKLKPFFDRRKKGKVQRDTLIKKQ